MHRYLPAPSPSATPSPVPTEIPKQKVSPEAENGVWTPDGTNWKLMVDGTAYTGWLTKAQIVIDIISIRTESCRPAGSP